MSENKCQTPEARGRRAPVTFIRRLACKALLLLVLSVAHSPETFAAQKAPAGNRFLFVVETSNAMLPFEHAGRQAVFDLIYSGIGGQIKGGDTIGIWNF